MVGRQPDTHALLGIQYLSLPEIIPISLQQHFIYGACDPNSNFEAGRQKEETREGFRVNANEIEGGDSLRSHWMRVRMQTLDFYIAEMRCKLIT